MGFGCVYAGQRGGVPGVRVLGVWVSEALGLVGHRCAELFCEGGSAVPVWFVQDDVCGERFVL